MGSHRRSAIPELFAIRPSLSWTFQFASFFGGSSFLPLSSKLSWLGYRPTLQTSSHDMQDCKMAQAWWHGGTDAQDCTASADFAANRPRTSVVSHLVSRGHRRKRDVVSSTRRNSDLLGQMLCAMIPVRPILKERNPGGHYTPHDRDITRPISTHGLMRGRMGHE
jgi:hypothetical protein